MKANALLVAVVSLTFLSTACEGQPGPPTAGETRAGLAAPQTLPASSPPTRGAHIQAIGGALVPDLSTSANEAVTARVVLPGRANGQIHVEDAATGMGIDIALVGAKSSVGQVADSYVVFQKGYGSGSIYERAEPSGVEDYVAFDERPASPSIAYNVALGAKVAGLRLVENQLEMLDSGGVPRLRVAPPYVVGADDALTDALVAVEGCALDTSPAGPWGRKVTPPGAKSCRVRISWSNDSVQYPALVDPRWQTTGSMSVARQDHNLVYLPLTGKVLAVGGRNSPTGTTGLASAELFDKASGTWSATGSMSGGRWSASATLLGSSSNGTTSQKVLVAGGINGTTSLTSARLYNQTAGTWAAAGTLNAARHLHTATLLADGRVLVCGGMNGSTVLTSAALYNPASGSGSWAATTGPIPPPGWRSGTATLIQTSNGQLNNKVLLAGGNNGSNTISAVYLFDPAQSAFSTLASMPSPREGHQAVALSDGRILFSGGKNGSTYLASTVIFDPSWGPGNWTAAGSMTSARWGHAMNLIPSGVLHLGLVLVSGGSNGTSTLSSTEYWNGTNWATDGAMVAPVQKHGSVGLGNSILVAGGAINNGSTTVSAAEIYDPSIALGCTSGSQCASGFCVSGVCCDSACNGGCGSCNLTGHLGVCTPLTSGTVCRALTGICDATETCDGSSLACPANTYQPSTTVCRASADTCDVAETCTGASAACPLDVFQPATTVCRDSADICDVAESCTGTSAACPADAFLPPTTVCRDSAGACDVTETCTGTSADCPPDAFQVASTICRASTGACDPAETCTGTSTSCAPDVVAGPPIVPSGLSAASASGQVSLAWSASPGATSYNVNRSTTSGGSYATIASPTSTSFTDTGLTNGTTYYYVVTAVGACGESANSNEVSGIPQVPTGVTPTLNCVMQINSSTYGAVFGYVNTTGSNVTLGAGPNNLFSPGPADLGQPILFVPGQVPIATFQTFPSGNSLTYTIGQQSVVASASSPICSSDLAAALATLYVPTTASADIQQQLSAIIGNPNFAAMIAIQRTQGPTLTPYQSALLDAADLIAANADLVGDASKFSASQLSRLNSLRSTLLSNPAIVQLRLFGDAQRAAPVAIGCSATKTINAGRPASGASPPPPGSIASQATALLSSASLSVVQAAVASVADSSQSAALLATNGLILATFQPAEALDALQLSDTPIPTCWTCYLEGAVGAIVGGWVGGIIAGGLSGGNPWAVIVGVGVGGYLGWKWGYAGFPLNLTPGASSSCGKPCSSSFDCGGFLGDGCVSGCCGGSLDVNLLSSYTQGSPGNCSAPCMFDSDCGSGLLCVQSCCLDPQTYANNCPSSTCTQDSDCFPGNHCLFGCCLGPCGFNVTSCSPAANPPMCEDGGGNQTCPAGTLCGAGCCGGIIY